MPSDRHRSSPHCAMRFWILWSAQTKSTDLGPKEDPGACLGQRAVVPFISKSVCTAAPQSASSSLPPAMESALWQYTITSYSPFQKDHLSCYRTSGAGPDRAASYATPFSGRWIKANAKPERFVLPLSPAPRGDIIREGFTSVHLQDSFRTPFAPVILFCGSFDLSAVGRFLSSRPLSRLDLPNPFRCQSPEVLEAHAP